MVIKREGRVSDDILIPDLEDGGNGFTHRGFSKHSRFWGWSNVHFRYTESEVQWKISVQISMRHLNI